jgi:hypothetical protein
MISDLDIWRLSVRWIMGILLRIAKFEINATLGWPNQKAIFQFFGSLR